MRLYLLDPQDVEEGQSPSLTQKEVLLQLELITSSPLFSKSKRYPNFLRYIVERTLSGEMDQLKERTLGIEVFRRATDYDTNSDPVVRITAGEIRKRLAQYYGEPGHGEQLRVDLPVGSYTPLFSRPEIHPEPPRAELLNQHHLEASPHLPLDSDAQPPPRPEPALPEHGALVAPTGQFRSLRTLLAGVVLVLTLGMGTYLAHTAVVRHRERGIAAFWQSVLHSDAPALIVVGVHAVGPDGYDLAPLSVDSSRDSMLASMTITDVLPLSDLISYSRITDLLTSHDHAYHTQSSAATTFEQLQPGPIVLLGGLDNIWTLRLLAPLRFRFGAASRFGGEILDSTRPGVAWRFDYRQNARSDTRDYAIVASFFDSEIEQHVVVAAGIGKSGTAAATHFLTNTRQLGTWVAQSHPGAGGNFELVLSTDIVAGEQGPPRVIAFSTW